MPDIETPTPGLAGAGAGIVTEQQHVLDSRPAETAQAAQFDYSALPEAIASEAKASAERVRERLRGAVLDVGAELARIKDRLPHGQFGHWLAAEFGLTERTAQNYMAAAALAAKYETISVLRPKTLYLLAGPSTPDDVRQEIVDRLAAGEHLSDSAIQDMVGEARWQQQCQRRHGKRKPTRQGPSQAKSRLRLDLPERVDARSKENNDSSEPARARFLEAAVPTADQDTDSKDAIRVLEDATLFLSQRSAEVLALPRHVRLGRAMAVMDALGIGINDLVPPGRR